MKDYSIIAALRTDLLRSKFFASKHVRKMEVEWGEKNQMAFDLIKHCLANSLVLAFLSWNDPFTPDTDASVVGAGAVLTHLIQDREFTIAFASHRFPKLMPREGQPRENV